MLKRIKDIPGLETRYAVTKDGKVWSYPKSTRSKNGNWLAGSVNKSNGYVEVCIFINNKPSTQAVHRLVAKAWIPNLNNLPHINHKNCDKTDNRIENLEWCTPEQNVRHALLNNRWYDWNSGEKHYQGKLTWEKVRSIRQEYRPRKVTAIMLASKYGVTKSTIYEVIWGDIWKEV